MRIVMVGSGYVGLVSGACFAAIGHEVVCVDNDVRKIAMLRDGGVPIFEPGLAELIAEGRQAGHIRFTADLSEAMAGAEAAFIAVGTPTRPEDGHADLRFVHQVAREVAAAAPAGLLLVTKSTVPVGTGDEIEDIVAQAGRAGEIHVASNPEFLKEGDAIADFMRPDRIVVGGTSRATDILRRLYAPLIDCGFPLVAMDRRGAELTKYAANALLATKITFINEIADLCEKVGTNITDVARGVGLDARIGARFLDAGPGYGGSCFPKDTLALVRTAEKFGAPQRIVERVVTVNDDRKQAVGARILAALPPGANRRVAVLGLTFKANTDDMRDSPAMAVVHALLDAGVEVRAYDPEGMDQVRGSNDGLILCEDEYQAAADADAIVVATEWARFAELDLERLRSRMRDRLFVDLRNLYPAERLTDAGFRNMGIGRRDQGPDLALFADWTMQEAAQVAA